MKQTSTMLIAVALLLLTAHRLPAPIQETPDSKKAGTTTPPKSKSSAHASQGFDGIWIGTETETEIIRSWSKPTFKPNSASGTVVMIISEGGKLVGKLRGAGPGRYDNVVREGNRLSFSAGNTKLELTLSADGRSLSENGKIEAHVGGGRGGARVWEISVTGIFHRGTTEEMEKHKNDPYPPLSSEHHY